MLQLRKDLHSLIWVNMKKQSGYYDKALAIDPNNALALGNKRLATDNLD
jgi:hypothetical protein